MKKIELQPSSEQIIHDALSRLEINFGFVEEVDCDLAKYFAEAPLLGLKFYDFSEDEAQKSLLISAEAMLKDKPSLVREIIEGKLSDMSAEGEL